MCHLDAIDYFCQGIKLYKGIEEYSVLKNAIDYFSKTIEYINV